MMVNRMACSACDYYVDYLGMSDEKPNCPRCNIPLAFTGKVGTVFGSGNDMRPAARELVSEWREIDADNPLERAMKEKDARHRFECADELEAVLEDHGVLVDG